MLEEKMREVLAKALEHENYTAYIATKADLDCKKLLSLMEVQAATIKKIAQDALKRLDEAQ